MPKRRLKRIDLVRILMNLEVPRLRLIGIKNGAGVFLNRFQVAIEVKMDLLVPVATGVAEDVGEAFAVGVAELLSVGGEDVVIAEDDVQEFVARVVPAAVVCHLDEIHRQRVVLRIAFAPQVCLDIMGIAVTQHQDAEVVATEDEGDTGCISQFG